MRFTPGFANHGNDPDHDEEENMMQNPNEAQECRWESGELGLSADHAVAAPEQLEREVDEALGLQLISIRLPRRLIDDLKLIATKEGLGYQPLVRRVLLRFAAAEFRSMAHEQLVSTLNEIRSAPAEYPEEEPRRAAAG